MSAVKQSVADALDAIKVRMEKVSGWEYFQYEMLHNHVKRRFANGGSFLLAVAKAAGEEEILALSSSVETVGESGVDFSLSIDVATASGILRAQVDRLRDSEAPTEVEVLQWSQVRSMQVVSYENAWAEHNRVEQTSVVFHFASGEPVQFVGESNSPTSNEEALALIAHARSRLA